MKKAVMAVSAALAGVVLASVAEAGWDPEKAKIFNSTSVTYEAKFEAFKAMEADLDGADAKTRAEVLARGIIMAGDCRVGPDEILRLANKLELGDYEYRVDGWGQVAFRRVVRSRITKGDNLSVIDSLVSQKMFFPEVYTVLRSRIADQVVGLAKKKLREQGKSFVTKPGQPNPLTALVKPIEDSLNSPRWDGLEDKLAEIGFVNAGTVDRAKATLAAKAIIEGILDGSIDAERELVYNRGLLLFELGPDGYKAFVDEYNNGK